MLYECVYVCMYVCVLNEWLYVVYVCVGLNGCVYCFMNVDKCMNECIYVCVRVRFNIFVLTWNTWCMFACVWMNVCMYNWTNVWEFILYDIHNYFIQDCQIINMEQLAKDQLQIARPWNSSKPFIRLSSEGPFEFYNHIEQIQYTLNVSEKHARVIILRNINLWPSSWRRDQVIRGAFALGISNNSVSA